MKKITFLFLFTLICFSSRALTLTECIKAAEDGVFLAQIELADFYYTGKSPIFSGEGKNFSKAKKYAEMALLNKNASGKETLKLLYRQAALVAKINYIECNPEGLSVLAYDDVVDKKKALSKKEILKNELEKSLPFNEETFFWAYAALKGSTDRTSEPAYELLVKMALDGMSRFATINPRFCGDYMYLCNQITTTNKFREEGLYKDCVKKGVKPNPALEFTFRKSADGKFKYIGEMKDGKITGVGIRIYDGSIYVGDIVDNEYQGRGVYKSGESGAILVGEWDDHKIKEGVKFEAGKNWEPVMVYKNKNVFAGGPDKLKSGEKDKYGKTIPMPVDMDIDVRWAANLLGEATSGSGGDLYKWGSVDPNHKFQSGNSSAPHYLPREACLAIYGGSNRTTDICGTSYDSATKVWSSGWRMPSADEFWNLVENSDITFIEDGTVSIVSKGSGKKEIKIKIPRSSDGWGIWTGSICESNPEKAYAIIFDFENGHLTMEPRDRESSFAVFPVTDAPFIKWDL